MTDNKKDSETPKKSEDVKLDIEEDDNDEEEEEEEDPFYTRIENSGCSKQHYALQDCFDENRDWRKCAKEMQNFKKCMDEQVKSRNK